MKLILIRHGETVGNVRGVIQGHTPGTLTERGKEQARKVAERLKDEKVDVIYSSDLKRAEDTAKEIARYHPETPLNFTREVRERSYGELEGVSRKDAGLGPKDTAQLLDIKEGETLNEFYRRGKRFLERVRGEHPDDTVVVVAHGGMIVVLTQVVMNRPPGDFSIVEKPKNAALNVFDIREDGNHRVRMMNSTEHLG